MPSMMARCVHIVWYASLLGMAVYILGKIFDGTTGGLRKGLGNKLGVE